MQPKFLRQLLVSTLAVGTAALAAGSSAAEAADACDAPTPLPVPATVHIVGTGTATSCTEAALRSAVTAGGYITFDCGDGSTTISVTSELAVTKTTVIEGDGHITLDGGHKNRIVVANDGTTLSVRNLRFVGGAAAESSSRKIGTGGAVAGLYKSHVEVIGSTFENNTAGVGGGAVAVATDSTLSITRSTFTGNSSWYGGAVYSLLSPLTVVDSTFIGNSTTTSGGLGDGGAIGTDGAAPTAEGTGGVISICGSVIKGNTGYGNGGGAYLWAYAPDRIIIDRTTFEGNAINANAGSNKGIGGAARISIGATSYASTGSITVKASSFLSNTSNGNGGALYLDCLPACDITNSTFEGNSAKTYGGAIFGDRHRNNNVTFANNKAGGHGGALFGKDFVLNNTVFVGNSAGNPWGQAMSCSSTGTGNRVLQWLTTSPDSSTQCIAGVIAADPKLAAPAQNGGPTLTMLPAVTSPVLNAGTGCESTDQRGVARDTGVCDLGAVQLTAAAAR